MQIKPSLPDANKIMGEKVNNDKTVQVSPAVAGTMLNKAIYARYPKKYFLLLFFFLFAFCIQFIFENHFDRSIGTGQFTGLAAGAAVFIILIMRHYHFAFEPFRQHQCVTVVRILLCDNLFMMCEIIKCPLHADKQ